MLDLIFIFNFLSLWTILKRNIGKKVGRMLMGNVFFGCVFKWGQQILHLLPPQYFRLFPAANKFCRVRFLRPSAAIQTAILSKRNHPLLLFVPQFIDKILHTTRERYDGNMFLQDRIFVFTLLQIVVRNQ